MKKTNSPTYVRKRVLLATSATILLLLSTGLAVNYQREKKNLLTDLETANFVVTSVDIISHTEENLTLGITITSDLHLDQAGVQVEHIELRLSYLGEEVTALEVSTDNFGNEVSEVVVTVPYSDIGEGGKFFGRLIESVFTGDEFGADVVGTVSYKVLWWEDSITFRNVLQFAIENQVEFEFVDFVLPRVNQTSTVVTVTVNNPWSSSLEIGGQVGLLVGSTLFGTVLIEAGYEILPGRRNYTFPFELPDKINVTLGKVLSSANQSVSIETSLDVGIGKLSRSVNQTLSISTSEGSAFSVRQIRELSESDGRITMAFDLVLVNPLPASFNLTRMELEAETLTGDTFLGVLYWNSTPALRVRSGEEVVLYNVTGVFRSDRQTFLQILRDGAISIRSGFIELDLYGQLVPVTFTIETLNL